MRHELNDSCSEEIDVRDMRHMLGQGGGGGGGGGKTPSSLWSALSRWLPPGVGLGWGRQGAGGSPLVVPVTSLGAWLRASVHQVPFGVYI